MYLSPSPPTLIYVTQIWATRYGDGRMTKILLWNLWVLGSICLVAVALIWWTAALVGWTNALVWWAAELVLWAVTLVGGAAALVSWTTALLRWVVAELERTWKTWPWEGRQQRQQLRECERWVWLRQRYMCFYTCVHNWVNLCVYMCVHWMHMCTPVCICICICSYVQCLCVHGYLYMQTGPGTAP